MATGFHEDTEEEEEEVVKILRRSNDAIRMKREKIKIKCPAKPITQAFLELENCEEGDKYIRSANMLRMELRERKNKIVQAMDVAERYQHKRLRYVKARLHDIQQIELRRTVLDFKKKTVVVGGQIIAKKTC